MANITKKQAQKWANALRSGKYSQTTRCLQDEKGYCCLGVACKIFIPEKKLELKKAYEGNKMYLSGDLPSHQNFAPIWLKNIEMDLNQKSEGKNFSGLNDDDEFTFDEIADVIELVYVHEAL